ncbi:MAG: homoserine kinase [Desulfurococcales archaeon]|nr:homoserine kinase [Desulfurococcales archaeon]
MARRVCVTAEAPSSSANLGSGFDVVAVAHSAYRDRVRACVEPCSGGYSVEVEAFLGPEARCAGGAATARRAVESLLEDLGLRGSVRVELEVWKGVPPGRGLGSSGASAAAAVYAASRALELAGLTPRGASIRGLVAHAGEGEAVAAGAPHYDNVAASLLGGVALVARTPGGLLVESYRPPCPVYLALAVPLEPPGPGKTRAMRGILPGTLTLREATAYAGRAAMLASALACCRLEAAGKLMMADDIVEARRAMLHPCYEEAVRAALDSGALGVSLSGAGPSMVALAGDPKAATGAAEAMAGVYRESCGPARPLVAELALWGARVVGVDEG